MANYLAKNLKYLRIKENLTQEEIAQELFNNGQRVKISNLETERSKKYVIEDIQAYAKYFGYTIDDLVNKNLSEISIDKEVNEGNYKTGNDTNSSIYKEKCFRNIPRVNAMTFIIYGIIIGLFSVIKYFDIGSEKFKNILLALATAISLGYMVYIGISGVINRNKEVDKYYLTTDKNIVYINNSKFNFIKYIIYNISTLLALLISSSMTFNLGDNEVIYGLTLLFIINIAFVITCICLSLKRKLKRDDTISYSLYVYEKIKCFFSLITVMLLTLVFAVGTFDNAVLLFGILFMWLSYYLVIKSILVVNQFYEEYSFEIK